MRLAESGADAFRGELPVFRENGAVLVNRSDGVFRVGPDGLERVENAPRPGRLHEVHEAPVFGEDVAVPPSFGEGKVGAVNELPTGNLELPDVGKQLSGQRTAGNAGMF